MLRSRAAITRMISRAKSGLSWTSDLNRAAVTGASVHAVNAVAVALRGAASMSAISPKTPPFATFSTCGR